MFPRRAPRWSIAAGGWARPGWATATPPPSIPGRARGGSGAFAATVTATGRALHRRWVETCFGPLLPRGPARAATVDLLVVATDVYTWKLLRRDRGLSAQSTRTRMETLARAVLAATAPGD